MRLVATLAVVGYLAVVVVGRSLWQRWRTGRAGFAGVRPGAGAVEWLAAGLLAAALGLAPVAPWLGPLLWSGPPALGLSLGALGLVATVAAQRQMGRSWRIGVDLSAPTPLITDGLFRWVRNPVFSAMVVAATGAAAIAPTPVAVAVPVVLAVAVALQVRRVEEPHLAQVHGARYRAWAARTGRFVPGLGRWREAPPRLGGRRG